MNQFDRTCSDKWYKLPTLHSLHIILEMIWRSFFFQVNFQIRILQTSLFKSKGINPGSFQSFHVLINEVTLPQFQANKKNILIQFFTLKEIYIFLNLERCFTSIYRIFKSWLCRKQGSKWPRLKTPAFIGLFPDLCHGFRYLLRDFWIEWVQGQGGMVNFQIVSVL